MIKLTTFGESHGVAVGGVIEGCHAGLRIDRQLIDSDLARRATGKTSSESQRRESDEVEFLSGLLDGVTLGTPIAFLVRNTDARPEDYADLKDVFRPSHADFTYQAKYGIRDWRGGGRASARTMLPYVVAGAIAKQLLAAQGVKVTAEVHSIGGETNPAKIEALLQQCREEGDTVGGIVHGSITGLPAGLGEPLDDKFQACLAKAMFTIPAVKGFEYGDGFAMASMTRWTEQRSLPTTLAASKAASPMGKRSSLMWLLSPYPRSVAATVTTSAPYLGPPSSSKLWQRSLLRDSSYSPTEFLRN